MAEKNTDHRAARIEKLIERLGENDALLERLESIVETAHSDSSASLDQIEEKLIELLRELGNETLAQWATRRERAVQIELKKKADQVHIREKKHSIFTPPLDE